MTDWLDQDAESHAVLRDSPWRGAKAASAHRSTGPLRFGSGSRPTGRIDREPLRHTDRRVLSPIDIPLWDRAKWRGTLFLRPPGVPPTLAIAFEDGESGQAVFRTWKDRWDNEDEHDDFRLAIITGVSKREPATYAVVVGPSLRPVAEDQKKIVVFGSRIHRMSPTTSTNLDNSVTAYKRAGSFVLAPARTSTIGEILEMPSAQLAIIIRQLDLRAAWQIGENHPDIAVLHKYDDPIVPTGVTDLPVKNALKRIRSSGWAMNRYSS